MLRVQRAVEQRQSVVLLLDAQLAAFADQALIALRRIQGIAEGGAALQQVVEHAERARRQVAAQQQTGLGMLQACAERAPQRLLSGKGHARIGVGQLAFAQAAGAQQRLAFEAEAPGGMQDGLGQAGADRGLRGVMEGGHAPILPNGTGRR